MRLKSVRLFGFKTFADRTEVNLDGGVIAVVGPNGCGKSNLVDAILWGLGEGNARHLRAASNQDVIFSGSPRRKPVGFAEVTLLFDNEDGALPIDSSEVSITRRLTRSGDSAYAINKRPCRLRDIYDLLADSGLGRSGYAIVGQKEIDAALAASPEDRRAWVDEAAGVQRYRSRKVESLKRLSTAQEHLARVADILRELEAQREPMREEAETALRYKNIQGSLREIEIGLLVNEVAAAVRDVHDLEKRIEESLKLSREEASRAEKLEEKAKRKGEEISELETEMDSIRALQQGSLTALERAESNLRLAEQRLQSLDDQERSLHESGNDAQSRIAEAEAEREHLRLELEKERAELISVETSVAGAGDEAKKLAEVLHQAEKELAQAREVHARRLKLEADETHRKERLRLIRRELKGIEESVPELAAAIAEAQGEHDRLAAAESERQSQVLELENLLIELRREDEGDAQAVRKALAERASLEGRKRGIEATIEAHEGLNQGARAVLEAADRGLLKAGYVPVGEAIETDRELALAIETALGGSVNDLIVDDALDAKAAISFLKEHRAGRATFQPIPLMRPPEITSELRNLARERGVVGRASELVRCQARHQPVIDSLLGRVLIVENIDVALDLSDTGGWHRVVTLEGEVLHHTGALTGGQQAKHGYGLVQRKADLAELDRELGHVERLLRDQEVRVKKRMALRAEREGELASLREEIRGSRTDLQEARQYLQTLLDELKSTERSKDRLLHEVSNLESAAVEALPDVDLAELERRRDGALKTFAAKNADAEQASLRIREAQTRVHQAEIRLEGGEKRLAQAKDAEATRQKRLFHLEPDREKIRVEIASAQAEGEKAAKAKTEADKRLEKAQLQKRGLLEESLTLTEEAKASRANGSAISEAAHQAELSRARAEARRATGAERLYEEYGLTEEDAIAQEGLHEVPKDAPALVSRLRRELRSMGDVNLGAIDAFERLTSRVEELSGQQEDILQGIEHVEASIRELDKLTREKFLTTFAAVQETFAAMFEKLFGGGSGVVKLTDSNNVLESGIDLQVTLPGKKQQPLPLLSGGERSLCASAFLFALLKVKPAPLVVLDEVDAPLDGRNVERFAETLHEFTDGVQFIVITHNPTTIESAPVWLGVTMQEPGVSTLVPARLPENKGKVAEESAVLQLSPSLN